MADRRENRGTRASLSPMVIGGIHREGGVTSAPLPFSRKRQKNREEDKSRGSATLHAKSKKQHNQRLTDVTFPGGQERPNPDQDHSKEKILFQKNPEKSQEEKN